MPFQSKRQRKSAATLSVLARPGTSGSASMFPRRSARLSAKTHSARQHFPKLCFVENTNAEMFRLVELAPWLGAREHVIGFLAHAATDASAQCFDLLRCFFPGHRWQHSSEDKSLAGQR